MFDIEEDIIKQDQFKIYKKVLSDDEEMCYLSQERKENALRYIINLIIDNKVDVDVNLLCCFSGPNLYKHVSESFLREFKDYVNWERAITYFKFSEEFIKFELPNKNWNFISLYQKLSESFIEEFKDKVNWDQICRTQKLSYNFIKKHHKEVNWEIVRAYQESWFRRINNLE